MDLMDNSNRENPCFSRGLIKLPTHSNLQNALISPIRKPISFKTRDGSVQRTKLGLHKCKYDSYDHNKSFPSLTSNFLQREGWFSNIKSSMDKIRGDSMNSCRFSAGRRKYSFSSIRPVNNSQSAALENLLPSEASTTISATLCASLSASPAPPIHKSVVLNPNKAVFTFDFKTMKILVVNQMACRLLGFSPDEFSALTLNQLLKQKHASTVNALSEEHLDTSQGTTLGVSGKVVEMVSKDGNILPVSLWLRRLEKDDRCLAVAEPVERRVAWLEIDPQGRIIFLDPEAAYLFQYNPDEVVDQSIKITQLIPAFLLPTTPEYLSKEVRKQKATGRTKFGSSFPLCLRLNEHLGDESGDVSIAPITYSVVIWVFYNMSGLLVLGFDGNIEQCNHHFSHIMFGFPQSQLIGKHITTVIPNFAKDSECEGDDFLLPPFQLGDELLDGALTADTTTHQAWRSADDTQSQSSNLISLDKSNRTDCVHLVSSVSQLSDLTNKPQIPDDESTSAGMTLPSDFPTQNSYKMFTCESQAPLIPEKSKHSEEDANDVSEYLVTADNTTCPDISQSEDDTLNANKEVFPSIELSACSEGTGDTSSTMCTCTSHPSRYSRKGDEASASDSHQTLNNLPATPAPSPIAAMQETYPQGHFIGYGRHRDGSNIEIVYQVRLVQLNCGRKLYCVWVSRDTEEEEDPHIANLTLTSSIDNSTIDPSFGQELRSRPLSSSRLSSLSMLNQCEDDLVQGEYKERYTTLQQIGKGAFGYVKMAFRNQDGLLVITKFINKKKVHNQSWVEDPVLGKRVPLEISLLATIKHPNVVQVLDIMENESFFQMVMEKHGAGMDLFEFVDRRPKLDEPLSSFIFRQIVAAVEYLHSLNILHRDIKDENVIIDHHFHAKLIDFGSATFMSSGRLFSTFYGTVEYCSPEVLAGNQYVGPELEMWSLGVTLYVLTFGENPFFDVDETLRAELRPPGSASNLLLELLHSMLERDPLLRCTMEKLVSHPWIIQPVDPSKYHFQDVLSCSALEYNPPVYYAEYCRSFSPNANQMLEDDDDRTDLVSSNSLTSLTPVEDYINGAQNIENNFCADGEIKNGKSNHPRKTSNHLASSTPLKLKPAEVDAIASTAKTPSSEALDYSESACQSSSSFSPVSTTSSSNGKSSSSIAASTQHKENDSLVQNLLEDFSERLLSYAGEPLSSIVSTKKSEILTDEEDYLNDEFEDDDDDEFGDNANSKETDGVGEDGLNGDIDQSENRKNVCSDS